ncbi:PREDICTED: exportin-2-like [Camelina sativa]|uniref:Exportin-2-like n=1 Tax=Camelina sativa TaxID=90675 RepID=A0ABM0Z140_CAMSA|nr:PREDICTED: exportin-2-like [Camelina sativa]
MSIFLVFHGTDQLVDYVDSVTLVAFIAFLTDCWAPSLKLITETNEIILTTAASTSLIFKSQALLDRSTDKLCGEMLDVIFQLVSNNEQLLSQSFAAAMTGKDPLTDIKDLLHSLCNSLSMVSPQYTTRYKEIIDKYLCQDKRAYLSKLCARYNCEFFKEEGVNGDGETTEQLSYFSHSY